MVPKARASAFGKMENKMNESLRNKIIYLDTQAASRLGKHS